MFERYTESARRALFYARYEASELGAHWIGTEHLLLGLLREPKGLTVRLLAESGLDPERTRAELAKRSRVGENVSTSVELPFTDPVKRALLFASSEADGLQHDYVGTEHLFLGLLKEEEKQEEEKEEEGTGATGLRARGLTLDAVRRRLLQLLGEPAVGHHEGTAIRGAQEEIALAKSLVMQLADTPAGTTQSRELAQRIVESLDRLKDYFTE